MRLLPDEPTRPLRSTEPPIFERHRHATPLPRLPRWHHPELGDGAVGDIDIHAKHGQGGHGVSSAITEVPVSSQADG